MPPDGFLRSIPGFLPHGKGWEIWSKCSGLHSLHPVLEHTLHLLGVSVVDDQWTETLVDWCRQRLGKLKALVGPMLGRAAEASKRPRALEAARSFLELVGKSANAWEAIKPWVNHTQRLDLLTQVCRQALSEWGKYL